MMKDHRYSNEIKSNRLQTSLYNSVSQTATQSRMAYNMDAICMQYACNMHAIWIVCKYR